MAAQPGATGTVTHVVANEDTAAALGSGDLPVLGTPRLLAWAEAASCDAVRASTGDGATSVGTRISLEHLRPSAVGARVTVTARLMHVDGRLLRFDVSAQDAAGTVIAAGEVTRVLVEPKRFLSRVPAP